MINNNITINNINNNIDILEILFSDNNYHNPYKLNQINYKSHLLKQIFDIYQKIPKILFRQL